MQVEVESLKARSQVLRLYTKDGSFLELYGISRNSSYFIHVKAEKCKRCRNYMHEHERLHFFNFLSQLKISPRIQSIVITKTPKPNETYYLAIVKLSNGEEIVMIPSDAIAFAFARGTFGVDWHLYVESEDIKEQDEMRDQMPEFLQRMMSTKPSDLKDDYVA